MELLGIGRSNLAFVKHVIVSMCPTMSSIMIEDYDLKGYRKAEYK